MFPYVKYIDIYWPPLCQFGADSPYSWCPVYILPGVLSPEYPLPSLPTSQSYVSPVFWLSSLLSAQSPDFPVLYQSSLLTSQSYANPVSWLYSLMSAQSPDFPVMYQPSLLTSQSCISPVSWLPVLYQLSLLTSQFCISPVSWLSSLMSAQFPNSPTLSPTLFLPIHLISLSIILTYVSAFWPTRMNRWKMPF